MRRLLMDPVRTTRLGMANTILQGVHTFQRDKFRLRFKRYLQSIIIFRSKKASGVSGSRKKRKNPF